MRLALLAEAEAEIDNAAAWCDDQRDGLGDELLRAVQNALDAIAEAPEAPVPRSVPGSRSGTGPRSGSGRSSGRSSGSAACAAARPAQACVLGLIS